jgi:tetratricopeptide (TPR) repeat protein
MSLLLDALKRAEQEKLARQGQEGAAPEPVGSPAGEPYGGQAAARRKIELELHPHPPAAEPADAPAPASATAPEPAAAATRRDREGAKTVFAAKQAEGAAATPAPAPGRKKAIIAVVVGAVVLAAAGGGYVWYEINKVPVARGPLPVAPRPVTPAKVDEAVPPVAMLKPDSAAATPERTKPEPKAAEKLVMNLLNESNAPRPTPPLKLARTIDPPRVSPQVSAGYDALKRGDSAAARKHYEAAVSADSTSLDAHLGLATAAARTGDAEVARRHYRRALELDPKNSSAVAGLAALSDFTRTDGLEEQLRADITRHPQSAALHFTLGNLYASQARWNEAQAAYFEAYRYDPDSADLAYNLAVSLDHLGQARLAAEFYQRALAAAKTQAAQFDKGQVSRRIAELKP